MTIQASGAGGVRLAPAVSVRFAAARSNGVLSGEAEDSVPISDVARGCDMHGTKPKLQALTKELEFLNSGGYRLVMGWRPPLVFEDSPICPKTPCSACPDAQCVLLDFVPEENRDKVIPCRHIPLNERGENLHTLYHTASMDEIEDALRKWLKKKIEELEQSAGAGTVLARTAAA